LVDVTCTLTVPDGPVNVPSAIHSEVLGQTRSSIVRPARPIEFHADAPPVGFVDENMMPRSLKPTHRLLLGQVTAAPWLKPPVGSVVNVQAEDPPVGSVEVSTPYIAPMAHIEVVGQDAEPKNKFG
jgi:hypothetical protein